MFNLISEKTYSNTGYKLHMFPTKKFQTITFYFHFLSPLNPQHIDDAQILPFVLLQGSEKFPNKNAIQQMLDRLYGALLFAEVSKKADKQVITFCLEMISPDLLKDGDKILDEGLKLLMDILFHPLLINNGLSENFIRLEKEKAIARLHGQKDNKIQYANDRLIETLFRDEPYGLPIYGTIEGLKNVTSETLTKMYSNFFDEQQIEIYILGDFDEQKMQNRMDDLFGDKFSKGKNYGSYTYRAIQSDASKDVVEVASITQGKLHLGFQTDITFPSNDYEAMQVCNGVFGAFSHSKCFLAVREQQSLAYYVTSKLESHHGFLAVMTGIDAKNEKQTRDTILEQLYQMQKGNVSEKEVEQTKAALRNEILCALDDPRGILALSPHQVLSGHTRTFSAWLKNIEKVTKEDVIQASQHIAYKGSFFLKGEEV